MGKGAAFAAFRLAEAVERATSRHFFGHDRWHYTEGCTCDPCHRFSLWYAAAWDTEWLPLAVVAFERGSARPFVRG